MSNMCHVTCCKYHTTKMYNKHYLCYKIICSSYKNELNKFFELSFFSYDVTWPMSLVTNIKYFKYQVPNNFPHALILNLILSYLLLPLPFFSSIMFYPFLNNNYAVICQHKTVMHAFFRIRLK